MAMIRVVAIRSSFPRSQRREAGQDAVDPVPDLFQRFPRKSDFFDSAVSNTVDTAGDLVDIASDLSKLPREFADLRQLQTDDIPVDCHLPQIRRHVVGAVILHLPLDLFPLLRRNPEPEYGVTDAFFFLHDSICVRCQKKIDKSLSLW